MFDHTHQQRRSAVTDFLQSLGQLESVLGGDIVPTPQSTPIPVPNPPSTVVPEEDFAD